MKGGIPTTNSNRITPTDHQSADAPEENGTVHHGESYQLSLDKEQRKPPVKQCKDNNGKGYVGLPLHILAPNCQPIAVVTATLNKIELNDIY